MTHTAEKLFFNVKETSKWPQTFEQCCICHKQPTAQSVFKLHGGSAFGCSSMSDLTNLFYILLRALYWWCLILIVISDCQWFHFNSTVFHDLPTEIIFLGNLFTVICFYWPKKCYFVLEAIFKDHFTLLTLGFPFFIRLEFGLIPALKVKNHPAE